MNRPTLRSLGSLFLTSVVAAMLVLTGMAQYRLLMRLSAIEADVLALRKERSPTVGTGTVGAIKDVSVPTERLSLDGAALKGRRDTRVALIEFADFECDFCRRFVLETLPRLEREYVATGKVLLAFRHLPLSHIHPGARRAAEAAECANRQNRFWEMHDKLFSNHSDFAGSALEKFGVAIGLRLDTFKACLQEQVADYIAADVASAQKMGISGTPTFLIGVIENDGLVKVMRVFVGARPFAELAQALDNVLTSTKTL
jgi:protein-disulfide isomerase